MAMPEDVTFAQRTCTTEFNGSRVSVKKGEAWAADDPFVRQHQDLFGPPARVRRTTPAPRVETAAQPPARGRLGRPSSKAADL